jgi:hypothetical protein
MLVMYTLAVTAFARTVGEILNAVNSLAFDAFERIWQLLGVCLSTLAWPRVATVQISATMDPADAIVADGQCSDVDEHLCASDLASLEPFQNAQCSTDHVACGDPIESCNELSACPPIGAHARDTEADFVNCIFSVKGLQGLKAALAAHFVHNPSGLPGNFRCGYVVDLDQHWITVHVIFERKEKASSLSLIVFDTLEVDYQRWHQVGLLRSTSAEKGREQGILGEVLEWTEDGVDVVTLCKRSGIDYEIAFMAPVCDMRRLTLKEEENIRTEKKTSKKPFSIYYDRNGNPFRKIIVQPILQAEQDGTCKSRALAVLAWLLKLDETSLAWYLTSHRELFHAELRAVRGKVDRVGQLPVPSCMEDVPTFGSLMATGKRDKFGRDMHLKVCHADTLQHNDRLEANSAAALQSRCLANEEDSDDATELALYLKREAELSQIRHISRCDSIGHIGFAPVVSKVSGARDVKSWRGIEDHESRWRFLEETCFFGHNIGFKKIKKLFAREDVLPKAAPNEVIEPLDVREISAVGALSTCEDSCQGFGATKYLRKYLLSDNYITHEADPMFHKPLENFFGFLCDEDQEKVVTVPFYILPFPDTFMALNLESHALCDNPIMALEGDPDWHKMQKVSDFVLPSGNTFLNDPISYNKACMDVSLPVKLMV